MTSPPGLAVELDFRKNPEVLTMVVDAMADGVFTVDAQGIFVAWSAGAERITGWEARDVVGQPCRILEGPACKGFGSVVDMLSGPTPPPGICCQECKVVSKDGRELYLHGNVRVLTDPDGRVAGAIGTFTDLTEFVRVNQKIAVLENQVHTTDAPGLLIGKSARMRDLTWRLERAARSDVTVFLRGESGTGKELAARTIHESSPRKDHPFVAVNCSAIPEALLESELFGHVRGAFTGATRDRPGLFESAGGGTLFLDEIGDLTPAMQLKLLRVLQEREVRRVGGDHAVGVDVRLVTATHRDPASLVASGAMREDFFYRIKVFEIVLPALRERREDIPLLIDHFLSELVRGQERRVVGVARDAMRRLMDHSWPGNVRELRNVVEQALVTADGDRITLLDLPPDLRAGPSAPVPATPPPRHQRRNGTHPPGARGLTREMIDAALLITGGNRAAAARSLGVSRTALWKWLRKSPESPGSSNRKP